MVVETNEGKKVSFFFDQKPELSFSGENVEIVSTAENVLYPMSDVAQIYFEQISLGVNDATLGGTSFHFTDGQIMVNGLAPDSVIAVYSANGTLCLQGRADGDGNAVLSTETLSGGMYIVQTSKVNCKIIKK